MEPQPLTTTSPTIGSLCTGILGLDMAVAQHFGGDLAWYSEVEPSPITLIEREHPGVPNLGDLKEVDWAAIPSVDILTAGYPCQPFSLAGRRKGTNDPRHLWPYISEGIRHLRPSHIVLENVVGHLSKGFDVVLRSLAESGYDAEWCVLKASDVGAPHQRSRLFVVATSADADDSLRRRNGEEVHREEDSGWNHPQRDGSGVGGWPIERWRPFGTAVSRWEHILGRCCPSPVDSKGRLNPPFVEWMMGYPEGWVSDLGYTASLKALGNAVVTQQARMALDILVPHIR